jgi:hypothetical protein
VKSQEDVMRALRVVGLSEDGKSVICEDVARSERFMVPADERLRAAARGDVTRLGQIEIELESQMRPREIQARIRAGESVEQVAATAGVPAHRIERFAYPVLLERSRTAELAQRAHPVREDGPDVQTLAEIAAHAFGLRGQDYSTATWDSWRGEDAKWCVQLHWHTGRSDNRAHWAFHPGAHGGTVIPLDDHAHDLMDPNAANRPLRTVRPVTELARQALEAQPLVREPELDDEPLVAEPPTREPVVREPAPWESALREPVTREPVVREPAGREPVWEPLGREPLRREPVVREPEPVIREPEPAILADEEPEPAPVVPVVLPKAVPMEPVPSEPAPLEPVVLEPDVEPVALEPVALEPEPELEPAPVVAEPAALVPEPELEPTPEPLVEEQPEPAEPAAATPAAATLPVEEKAPEKAPEKTEEKPEEPVTPPAATTPPVPQRKAEPTVKRGKKNHPIVPSWEDVLLGVRTQRG